MKIPGYIMDMMSKVLDDHPEVTHIAVRTDGHGGWNMDYVFSLRRAEELIEGYDKEHCEIVVVTDE